MLDSLIGEIEDNPNYKLPNIYYLENFKIVVQFGGYIHRILIFTLVLL